MGHSTVPNSMDTRLESEVGEDTGYVTCVSAAIHLLESVIREIGPTEIPVLITGESGTGKEVLAHRIHRFSRRAEEPLRKIACASTSNNLFVSELKKLTANGNGRRGQSGVGTLFFDEIGELESASQRTLLDVLPDGLPAQRSQIITARVISATSKNLDDQMRSGHFRSELYYRINGVCLRLPPLRERKEDIAPLVESFLAKHAAELGRPRMTLSERTMQKLFDHSWPGNVRELENVVKEIVVLGDEDLTMSMLSHAPASREKYRTAPCSLKAAAREASRQTEKELILKALTRTRWNRKRAAQELQISYKSLLYKLKQIGLPDDEGGAS